MLLLLVQGVPKNVPLLETSYTRALPRVGSQLTIIILVDQQVGACIVNEEKRIVGIGYNGMPRGCPDHQLPWGKTSPDPLETKYMYVCHAEMNAILNKVK